MKLDAMHKQYIDRPRHTILVDYVDHMDELSKLNGNYPELGKYNWYHSSKLEIARIKNISDFIYLDFSKNF